MFHCILHIFLHVLPKNFPDKPHTLSYYYLKIWGRGVILAFSWLRGEGVGGKVRTVSFWGASSPTGNFWKRNISSCIFKLPPEL